MRVLTIIFTMLSFVIPIMAADTNQVPLKLTANTDTNILFAEPIIYFKSSPDSPRYKISPATVTLTLTNTSEKTMKVNTCNQQDTLLSVTVTGPDNKSVKEIRYLREMAYYEPKETDFPRLMPGESEKMQFSFPSVIESVLHQPQQPGLYKVQFTYTALPTDIKFEEGSFHGAVMSNEIVFHLVEAANKDGMLFGIETQTAENPLADTLNVTGFVKNISDKSITIPAWNFLSDNVKIMNDKGEESPVIFQGSNASRLVTREEQYATIKPGEIRSFPMYGTYNDSRKETDTPTGTFTLRQPAGMACAWRIMGQNMRVTAQIVNKKKDSDKKTNENIWTGTLTSPTNLVKLNLTMHRRMLLEKNIDNFSLFFYYTGNADKPFYTLRLQTAPVSENKLQNDFFAREAQISNEEATAIILYLAKSGMLRDAMTIDDIAVSPTGYMAKITADADNKLAWKTDIGWNPAMLKKCDDIKLLINTKSQKEMDLVTGRLTGFNRLWIAEAEMQTPVNIIIPAGTLNEAYTLLNTRLKLSIPIPPEKEDTGKRKIPELNFIGVTVDKIKSILIQAAK